MTWSQDERNKIGAQITKLAAYYQTTAPYEIVKMYVNDLADLDAGAVYAAYERWRRNGKNLKLPLPAQIRSTIHPEASEEMLAIEASSRVIAAVGKFGWCNPAEAEAYIGELGWRAVRRYPGGWPYVCEHLGTSKLQIQSFQAQVREVCKAQIHLGKLGIADQPVGIPDLPDWAVIDKFSVEIKALQEPEKAGEESA